MWAMAIVLVGIITAFGSFKNCGFWGGGVKASNKTDDGRSMPLHKDNADLCKVWICAEWCTVPPPPPLHSNRLGATVSSHP